MRGIRQASGLSGSKEAGGLSVEEKKTKIFLESL